MVKRSSGFSGFSGFLASLAGVSDWPPGHLPEFLPVLAVVALAAHRHARGA
jgi:hypothetical protein